MRVMFAKLVSADAAARWEISRNAVSECVSEFRPSRIVFRVFFSSQGGGVHWLVRDVKRSALAGDFTSVIS